MITLCLCIGFRIMAGPMEKGQRVSFNILPSVAADAFLIYKLMEGLFGAGGF